MDPLEIVANIGLPVLNGILGIGAQEDSQEFNAQQAELNRKWQGQQNETNRVFTDRQNRLAREWQSAESVKARDWEEQMYNLYNSPSAMMQQYKQAGLNPYLGASGQTGQGMGTAAPMASSAGMSQPSMASSSPASSSGLYHPSLASDYAQIAGINANVSNQHAQASQTLWETYQYIYYHVGKDAAKKFLEGHPEMIHSDDPDNSPFMRQYQVAVNKQELEKQILDTQNWLLDRYGYQKAEKSLAQADAEIDNYVASALKSRKEANRVASEILRNMAQAGLMKKEGDYYVAQTETANQIRQYLVSMYMSKSGILDHAYQMDTVYFENAELLSGWLTSAEGKKVRMDMERIYGKRHADAIWTAAKDFFDVVGQIKGAGGVTTGSSWSSGSGSQSSSGDSESATMFNVPFAP